MSEVVEVGDPGWEMPVEGFRFRPRQLDRWCDGVVHRLRPNWDYPIKMPLREIETRLERAMDRRGGTARVWQIDGVVHIYLMPWNKKGLFPGQQPGEPPPPGMWPPAS